MTGALIILAITILTGIILYILDRKNHKGMSAASGNPNNPNDSNNSNSSNDSECCGLHLVCEKELTAIAEDRILYYDDEELDRFAGRAPEEYNSEETEEFRDILMTLLPHDVPGWARSLDRRNIRPPQEIRDELLIMLQEIA